MNQLSSKPMQEESTPIESVILDCDHILAHAGGDPVLLTQLCGTFLDELPIHIQSFEDAIKLCNRLRTGRALQQLRNCLIVFGSGSVSATADMLDTALRSGRSRQAQREWKRLHQQLQVLVPQVQKLLLEVVVPKYAVQ
jgi:hypothetical protein